MAYHNLFDDVASIGRKFLKSTSRGHQVLLDYSWQLASICSLLRETHKMVIAKLEAIENAETLPEASAIIQEMNAEGLSKSFRITGLCDIFQGYGKSLHLMSERLQNQAGQGPASPLTIEETWRWLKFCDALEQRELQVADLYVSEIQALRELAADQDLAKIKKHAMRGKKILTDQVADFDALAERFSQMRKR